MWLCFIQYAHAQNENFKLGGFLFDLAATLEVIYDDNINYAEYNPRWDIIIQPGISLNGRYQVSELNTLSVNVGIGYSKYLRTPELDSINNFLNINPDTEIAFTIFIDDVTIEFYDRLAYSVDASDAFGLNGAVVSSNPLDYGRFTNIAGVDVDWDLNDIVLFAGFSRMDIIPTSSTFDYTRRHDYSLVGGPRFLVADNLTLGVTATGSRNIYDENVNNNSWSWSAGPMAIWQASENLSFSGNIAYQEFYFDDTGSINDSSQPSGLVGAAAVSHRWSSVFEHSLSAAHSFNFGYLSNVDSVFSLTYAFNWRMNSKISPRGQAYWELGSDSGGSGFNALGFPVSTAENYSRYGIGVGIDYRLSTKITTSLDYAFTHKKSNLFNRSYYQNQVTLGLRYDF
ncbi:hypothetical protein [Cerasicoccus arenae]|uniref:hypothetical protein n=1 Tax=Cerasicoccus arenae TaxID=424488 RepID=UPI00167504F8|nr:hypothetical protein [Cerasicoccus arenae]MBK1858900.1 hypothetical protein [Cerasicoccus arenae]